MNFQNEKKKNKTQDSRKENKIVYKNDKEEIEQIKWENEEEKKILQKFLKEKTKLGRKLTSNQIEKIIQEKQVDLFDVNKFLKFKEQKNKRIINTNLSMLNEKIKKTKKNSPYSAPKEIKGNKTCI